MNFECVWFVVISDYQLKKYTHPLMALIKTPQERELTALQKVEKEMKHHIHMKHVHHVIMGALGALAVAAFFTGRFLRR